MQFRDKTSLSWISYFDLIPHEVNTSASQSTFSLEIKKNPKQPSKLEMDHSPFYVV